MSCPRQRRKSLSPKLTLHFRRLRVCAAIVALCQVISLTGYLYFAGQVAETYAENINVRLEISTAVTATPTPTPEATPTPTPFGGGPPQPLPPQLHPDPYVPGEGTVAPYVYVGMLDGVALQPGDVGTTYAIQPNVIGKTNLADAVVFIESTDTPGVFYTVHANISGIWEFTWPNPLPLGWHTLYLTAISPVDPGKRATATFNFEIIPIPPVPPIVSPTPPTPAVSPTPPTPPVPPVPPAPPIPVVSPTPKPTPVTPPPPSEPPTPPPPLSQLIDVDVIVRPPNVQVTPPDKLPVIVRLERLVPDGQKPVSVRVKVRDEDGNVVLERTREIVVPKAAEFTEEVKLPINSKPGRYWVSAELTQASSTVLATAPFIVATASTAWLPAAFQTVAPDVLVRLGVLSAMIVAFVVWLIIEFLRTRRQGKVSPDDLLRGGMVR